MLDSLREIVRLTRIFTLMRNRRTNIGLLFLLATVVPIAPAQDPLPAPIVIDASAAPTPPQALPFRVGGQSPGGHALSANDRYLMMDGTPWFPLMGEFHYSRYPENQWEKELLKIKAAGIQVISTYVFWIHHEEVEGEFNWTGKEIYAASLNCVRSTACTSGFASAPLITARCAMADFPTGCSRKRQPGKTIPCFCIMYAASTPKSRNR